MAMEERKFEVTRALYAFRNVLSYDHIFLPEVFYSYQTFVRHFELTLD